MNECENDQKFFGRKEQLALLKRRVSDLKEGYRHNVAILGNPYLGKSTLLEYFSANIDDEQVVAIYIDLDNKDFSYLFFKLTGSILYHYAKIKKLPLHENLNLMLEVAQGSIPRTVQVIKKIRSNSESGKKNDAYLGLLTLMEVFTNETDLKCVLILDEFQNLENFGIPHVFQILGKKIMMQKKCFYVVASSNVRLAQKILCEKLSLLFGNFENIIIDAPDCHKQYYA